MYAEPIKHKILEAILSSNEAEDKQVIHLPKDGLLAYLKSTLNPKQQCDNICNEPFFTLDIGRVVHLMQKWVRAFPTIHPYYAVKCNTHPAIICILATLGANFDCASKSEIELVLSLGISSDRIILANPCKQKSHIVYAKSVGVNLTTYDSLHEVEKMQKLHPRCGMLLRIKAPEGGSKYPLGSKYGALPYEVEPLLEAAKAARLRVLGISFHVGSCSNNPKAYEGGISLAKAAFETAARLELPNFSLLDIGGGFVADPNFETAAEAVYLALKVHFNNEPKLTVIAEPGRYLSETVVTFMANVIGKRVRGNVRDYWINDGIYGVLNCIKFDETKGKPKPFATTSNPENPNCDGERRFSSTVFGPTLDSADTVLVDYPLPELAVDDWLLFEDMGAYASVLGSNFNGFATSEILTRLVYTDVDVTTSFQEDYDKWL